MGLKRPRAVQLVFATILVFVTFALCEVAFRIYDRVTMPEGNLNTDQWIRNITLDLNEHKSLGYQYQPLHKFDERTQADEFGMRNAKEALLLNNVDVVGVGDSYLEVAHRTFFDEFARHGIKYRSLGLFGYGPANYNVLMEEFGPKLKPKAYVYSTYLANDPGDARRFETWRASGKGWYEFNGGYVFPIERQGLMWGWRLFLGRAKAFTRNLVSRLDPDSYGSLRGLVKQDDASTVFEYIKHAKEIADRQQAALVVVIVPRWKESKPWIDPVASKLVTLCAGSGITCLDLDPSFGDADSRARLFAPDKHWNDEGMEAAWTYLWEQKLAPILTVHSASR